MTILCKEVWVSFKNQNKHGQRIASSECSGAQQLAVSATDQFLSITYLANNKDAPNLPGKPLKVLCFNKSEVHEFCCEGNLSIVDDSLPTGNSND